MKAEMDQDLRRLRFWLLLLLAANALATVLNLLARRYLTAFCCAAWTGCVWGMVIALKAHQKTRDEIRLFSAALRAGPPTMLREEDL